MQRSCNGSVTHLVEVDGVSIGPFSRRGAAADDPDLGTAERLEALADIVTGGNVESNAPGLEALRKYVTVV